MKNRGPAFFFGAHINQHDDEQKQHHHPAHVNQNLHAGDEFSAQQNEERGHRYQRRDKEQRRVHGVASHHGQQPREDHGDREDPEEYCFPTGENHFVVLCPGSSSKIIFHLSLSIDIFHLETAAVSSANAEQTKWQMKDVK